MDDIPEISPDMVSHAITSRTQTEIPEIDSSIVASDIPEINPDDVAPSKPQSPLGKEFEHAKLVGQVVQSNDAIKTAQETGRRISDAQESKKGNVERSFDEVGGALKFLQKNVGKHLATTLIKAHNYELDAPNGSAGAFGQTMPLKGSPDYAKAQEALGNHKSPGQQAYEAAPLFKDIPRATAGELVGRKLLEATGANQLEGQQQIDAEAQLTTKHFQVPVLDDVSAAKAIEGAASFVGDMPYFMLGGELAPIGRVSTAGDIADVTAAALTPAVKLARVKGLQATGAAIEGGFQGATLAAKDNQSQVEGAVGGAVAGAVLHSFMGMLTKDAGAKAEVLASEAVRRRAADPIGAVLAPQTWEQYVRDMTAEDMHIYPEKSPTPLEPFTGKASGGDFEKPATEYTSRREHKETGDRGASYAVRSATLDKNGDVWEVRRTQNINTGVSKTVYKTKLDSKEKILDFLRDGVKDTSDKEALAVLANKAAQHEPGYDAFRDDSFPYLDSPEGDPEVKTKLYQQMGNPEVPRRKIKTVEAPLGDTRPTANDRPVMLTPDRKGDLQATPIDDGGLDPTVFSPKKAKVGDMVRTPDGDIAEVVAERGPTAVLRSPQHGHAKVAVHDLVPVDESTLNREAYVSNSEKVKNRIGSYTSEKPLVKQGEGVIFRDKRIGEGDLLTHKKLTVPRVMKILNTDSAPEAKGVLAQLEKDGRVLHDGKGGYFVRQYKPEFPDLPDHGHKVYIGVGNEGQGRTGILRGRDPKNPNNYLVEVGKNATPVIRDPVTGKLTDRRMGPFTADQYSKAAQVSTPAHPIEAQDVFPKTKMLSVPSQKVRTWKPVIQGEAGMSQLPHQLGVQLPLPSGIVVTNQNVAQQVADMSRQVGQLSKIGAPLRAIKLAMGKLINHEAWMVPTELRSTVTSLSAQPSVYKMLVAQYQQALSSRLGGIGSSLDTDLNAIISKNTAKGVRSGELQKLAAKYPELVGQTRQTIDTALQMMKDNSEALAKYGIHNVENLEKLRSQGVLDEYTQNVYLKRLMMRDDFIKFVKTQLPKQWEDAVRLTSSRHPEWGSQNVESRMLEILGAEDADVAKLRTMPTGDAAKMLKKRIELAGEIKAIIGDVNSASVRVAHSMASSQSIKNTIGLWNDIAKTKYWSPGPRVDLGTTSGEQIPNLPIYGDAAGGRLHSSMKFLLTQRDTAKEGLSMFNTLSGIWKKNMVILGGAAQWTNNVMRNWKGMVLSGGLQTPEDLATFFDAAQIMMQYHANPILSASSSLYNEALQNGTIDAGFGATEVSKHRTANKIMAAISTQKGKATSVFDILKAAGGAIEGGQEEITAAYDQIDKIFKFTAYLNVRRNALAEGMNINDAAALGKIRVTQSFPMFSMVSPVVDKMRRGSIAGIAPFLSGKAEDIRINGTAIKRLVTEPELWGRMIGAAGVVAGSYGFMREIRRANGITDADAYAATNSPKLLFQKFKPTLFVGPWLDEQGRMQMYDLSSWEDLLQSMQSHPMDPMLESFIRNQFTGVFGDNSLPGQAIDQTASKLLNLHPLTTMNPPQWRPGENGIMNTLAFFAQNGMVPGVLERLGTIGKKTQPNVNPVTNAQNPVWTQSQATAKLAGSPFAGPVGPELQTGRAMELGVNLKDMGKQMGQGILNNTGSPEKQQSLVDAKKQAMDDFIKNYEQSQRKP